MSSIGEVCDSLRKTFLTTIVGNSSGAASRRASATRARAQHRTRMAQWFGRGARMAATPKAWGGRPSRGRLPWQRKSKLHWEGRGTPRPAPHWAPWTTQRIGGGARAGSVPRSRRGGPCRGSWSRSPRSGLGGRGVVVPTRPAATTILRLCRSRG